MRNLLSLEFVNGNSAGDTGLKPSATPLTPSFRAQRGISLRSMRKADSSSSGRGRDAHRALRSSE
jgi:hypothetical protein